MNDLIFNPKNPWFDPGHGNGANVDENCSWYSEGTNNLNIWYEVSDLFFRYNKKAYSTRTSPEIIPLEERGKMAGKAGCDWYFSIHSNYPTPGIIVYYSIKRPKDKEYADYIAENLSKALGFKNRGSATRHYPNNPKIDYSSVIRNSIAYGVKHAFVVEHGNHCEMAKDTKTKNKLIAKTYLKMLYGINFDKKGVFGLDFINDYVIQEMRLKPKEKNVILYDFDNMGQKVALVNPESDGKVKVYAWTIFQGKKIYLTRYRYDRKEFAGFYATDFEDECSPVKIKELENKIIRLSQELTNYNFTLAQYKEKAFKYDQIKGIFENLTKSLQ